MAKKNKTFKDLYEEAQARPKAKTPAQEFVEEVMALTHRSENAVRSWLMGRQVPDDLVKQILAKKFNVDPDGLFPVERHEE